MARWALVVALLLPAFALAGEPRRWEGEEQERQRAMEEMADGIILGQVRGEERAQVERYWATHLRQAPMDAIAAARYNIAEIQLARGDAKAAAAALEKVLEGQPGRELASTTHFNLGEIARRHLKDSDLAAKHYAMVRGAYRYHALHYLLGSLIEAGRGAEAAQIVEKLVAESQETGEKLALLQRLAALYRRADMADEALKTYERITRDFKPADLKGLRDAAAEQAEELVGRMRALAEAQRGPEVQRLERQIHQRARELRLAGRTEEFEAFRTTLERHFREFDEQREAHERERAAAERRERERREAERRRGEF